MSGGLRTADLLGLAAANVRRNRTRSGLTIAGVAVGVAALLALLAYGKGLQRVASDEFNALDLYNTLRVTSTPNPVNTLGDVVARVAEDDQSDAARVPLTDSLLAVLAAEPGVLAAYPEIAFPVRIQANGREVAAGAEAVPLGFERIEGYQPAAGAFFQTADDSAVVVPEGMLRRLGWADPAAAVGDSLDVATAALDFAQIQRAMMSFGMGMRTLPLTYRTHRLRIAGVLPERGQAVAGFFRVLVPLGMARRIEKVTFFSTIDLMMRRGPAEGYPAARVQLRDAGDYAEVKAAIEARGAYATGFREQFQQLERLFVLVDGSLLIIGLIALIVATLGIANTTAMNVLERRREIGVMKAVGGEDGDVARLFVAESALLGALGGVAGVALGWAVTAALGAGVAALLRSRGLPAVDVFDVTPGLVAAVLGVALAVSAVAGVLPARRAARTAPVDALRS